MKPIARSLAPLLGALLFACGGDATGPAVPVAEVRIVPAQTSTLVGTTIRLKAIVLDVDGEEIHRAKIRWKSSNTLLALVDGEGFVTTTRPGDVTITATAGGQSATAQVRVRDLSIG